MPKAFTHLCDKVNLSLYQDTLTVYPKSKTVAHQADDQFSLVMLLLFAQMNCVEAQVDNFFYMYQNMLGIYRFVHREDKDHYLYHQDSFSMEEVHYHAQFEKVIDEPKLENILEILEANSLITTAEHQSFIRAYHEANTLPQEGQVMTNTKALGIKEQDKTEQKAISKENVEQPTFAGFKRGFLYRKSASRSTGTGNVPDELHLMNIRRP